MRPVLLCCRRWSAGWCSGNQWYGWVEFLSFFRHVAKIPSVIATPDAYERAAEFGPRFMFQEFWIVSEYPDFIRRDAENRPHAERGPFCRWRDGRELFYWHGVEVPREWITSPDTLDPATALTWPNVEQRRAAAEIVGWRRILDATGARSIDVDIDPMIGELLEADLPEAPGSRFLRVTCGTGRQFCLPVPREMRTAVQANAWTYGETDTATFRKYEVRT